jgi:hypothetical protein
MPSRPSGSVSRSTSVVNVAQPGTAIAISWSGRSRAVGVVAGVSEPIRVWRVSCTSASEVADEEMNANLQAVDEWEQRERQALFAADGLTSESPDTHG